MTTLRLFSRKDLCGSAVSPAFLSRPWLNSSADNMRPGRAVDNGGDAGAAHKLYF
jgi:hypothetical protein